MFRKIISVLMVTVLIITCFSGCKKQEETGEALACAISQMPDTFDPQIASSTVERMISVNIFDGLFKLDEMVSHRNVLQLTIQFLLMDLFIHSIFKKIHIITFHLLQKALLKAKMQQLKQKLLQRILLLESQEQFFLKPIQNILNF